MIRYLESLFYKASGITVTRLFLYVLVILVFIAVSMNFVDTEIKADESEDVFFESKNTLFKFFTIVFFTPLIETFLLNFLPYQIFKRFIKKNVIIIILNALLFSVLHHYSYTYMVMTFIGGIFLNFFYVACVHKKHFAFLFTTLLHAVYNLIGFILIDIFEVL